MMYSEVNSLAGDQRDIAPVDTYPAASLQPEDAIQQSPAEVQSNLAQQAGTETRYAGEVVAEVDGVLPEVSETTDVPGAQGVQAPLALASNKGMQLIVDVGLGNGPGANNQDHQQHKPKTSFSGQQPESEEAPQLQGAAGGGSGEGEDLPPLGGSEFPDEQPEDDFDAAEQAREETETTTRVLTEDRMVDNLPMRVVYYDGSPSNSPEIARALERCHVVAMPGPYAASAAERAEQERAYTDMLSSQAEEDTRQLVEPSASAPEGDISGTLAHLEGGDKRVVLLGITGDDIEVAAIETDDEARQARETAFHDLGMGEISESTRLSIGAAANRELIEQKVLRRQVNALVEQTAEQDPYAEIGIVVESDKYRAVEEIGRSVAREGESSNISGRQMSPEELPLLDRAVKAGTGQGEGDRLEEWTDKYIIARLMTEHMPEVYPNQPAAERLIVAVDASQIEPALIDISLSMREVTAEPLEDRINHMRSVLPQIVEDMLTDLER